MAGKLSIPTVSSNIIPPTPTEDNDTPGLGLNGVVFPARSPNANSLSPFLGADSGSSAGSSPMLPFSPDGPKTAEKSPFNFQSQLMDMNRSPVARSNVGQRRGHKYKHSSISANIFLEPAPKAPLTIPASLPIPTLSECWSSMDQSQTVRLYWCLMHASIAALVLWTASGSLALTALSHLLLYDAFGAMLVVSTDVLSNFDVWKRSSIRHPFGLARAEVLSGFAMSVLLLFMGFDLVSHTAQHMLEGVGNHEAHFEHAHERVSAGEVDAAAVAAICATLISALVLKNHGRISKVLRFGYFEQLPGVLGNPSHFLTLLCSALLILLPLMSVQMYTWLDRAISGTVALSMCALGAHLVYSLGMMLLMSYNGGGVADVLTAVEADQSVVRIEEAKFWHVHYGLNMANFKLHVKGSDDNLAKLRERITSLVRNRLGGGYGSGGARWEVSTQMIVDR